ncbi:hypothetical protein J6I39_00720 [bacterium]|nr:hypothetical protein [bacterium]
MKVDVVNQNYQSGLVAQNGMQNRKRAQSRAYLSASPAFTGAKLSEIQKIILKMMPKSEQRWFNVLNKIQDFSKGEMGGIVITAAGTGLVAPLPIAFNPFVKAKPDATEEEKAEVSRTKQYTAWRQPISAVLAILFQASVLKPIDKFLQNLTNDEGTANIFKSKVLNQASLNDEQYLERKIRKSKMPIEGLEIDGKKAKIYANDIEQLIQDGKISLKNIELKDDNGVLIRDEAGKIKTRPETVEEAKERIILKEKERIITKQKNAIVESLKKDGTIKMGKFNMKDADVARVVNNNIDDYIRAAKDLRIPTEKLKEHAWDGADFIENETELRKILGKDKIDALPRISEGSKEVDPNALRKYLTEQRKSASSEAVDRIIRKILRNCDSVIESNCTETLNRIDKIHNIMGGKDKPFSMDKYHKYLSEQNEILRSKVKELEALKFTDVTKATAKDIKETISKLVDACKFEGRTPEEHEKLKLIYKDNGAFLSNRNKLVNKVYNDVVSCYKELVGHRFGLFKQLSKVCVGVFVTLPITCTALNWIYPRFMELFFPNLAGIKKDEAPAKGGEQ